VAQTGFRLDAVKFAATDQAVHDSYAVTTTIGAEEHVVTAPKCNHLEQVFAQVIVYLHPAIAAVLVQGIPLFSW